jgi:hypothetical protein
MLGGVQRRLHASEDESYASSINSEGFYPLQFYTKAGISCSKTSVSLNLINVPSLLLSMFTCRHGRDATDT